MKEKINKFIVNRIKPHYENYKNNYSKIVKGYASFFLVHGTILVVPSMFFGIIDFSLFNLVFGIPSMGIVFYYITEELPTIFKNIFYYVRNKK